MIDDLRPATEYEFAVKIVRGRRQSPWSLGIILHKMAIITIFGHKHFKLKNFRTKFNYSHEKFQWIYNIGEVGKLRAG